MGSAPTLALPSTPYPSPFQGACSPSNPKATSPDPRKNFRAQKREWRPLCQVPMGTHFTTLLWKARLRRHLRMQPRQ